MLNASMQPLFVILTFMWLVECFMLSSLDGSQRTALELSGAYSLVWEFMKKIYGSRWSCAKVLLCNSLLLVFPGGRFGNLFDDDPKQWRMYADFIGSAGRSEHAFLFLYGNVQMKYSSKETLTTMVSHAAFLIWQPSYILDIFFLWHLLVILLR